MEVNNNKLHVVLLCITLVIQNIRKRRKHALEFSTKRQYWKWLQPSAASIYLLKVNNRNTEIQFLRKLYGTSAFPQNFHTMKLGEITVNYPVNSIVVSQKRCFKLIKKRLQNDLGKKKKNEWISWYSKSTSILDNWILEAI